MQKRIIAAVAGLAFSLNAAMAIAATPEENVVATVNGEAVTEDMLLVFAEQLNRRNAGGGQVNRDAALEQLINFVLVTQDVERQGIDKRPEVQRELAWQRRGMLVTLGMREYMQKHPVTDADIQAAYEDFVKQSGNQEYKARHILLKTEDEAKAVIAELDKGADFAELAKTRSTGPSGKNGGDLGWFNPQQMVPEFSQATAAMTKGSYSSTPVKTQFGWHVIKLEDTRKSEPPSLDEVRQQLQAKLSNERIEAYISELRKKATIKE